MFGRGYEEIGSSDKGLILKNSGKIKILWGKKFIDLLDSNGNLNAKVLSLIKKVSSENEIKDDGFYYFDDNLIAKIGDNILELTSESGTTFVSFMVELEITSEQKYTVLKNIGFVYKTLSENNIYPKNGIIYIEDSLSLFIVNDGVLSKYTISIPNLISELFIIQRGIDDDNVSEGALIIKGEGLNNALIFDNIKIYSKGNYSILESNKEFQFKIKNENILSIDSSGLKTNNIKSFGANNSLGYRIYKDGEKYVLDIDKINVREGIDIEDSYNYYDNNIYSKRFIINLYNIIYNNVEDINYLNYIIFNTDINNLDIENNSLVQIPIRVSKCELSSEVHDGTTIYYLNPLSYILYKKIINEQEETKSEPKEEIIDLIFNYLDYKLYLLNEDLSSVINPEIGKYPYISYDGLEYYYIKLTLNNETYYYVPKEKDIDKVFLNRNLYVISEPNVNQRLHFDFNNSSITLKQNDRRDTRLSEYDQVEHTKIGNISDVKTYDDDENENGLFSDMNVFVGGEFRHPIPTKEIVNSESKDVPVDISYKHFPRYSVDLNKGMTIPIFNHDEIILPKKWIPQAANYIEDLSSQSNNTLITRDDNLYDGKLFLYKVTGTSNNLISVSFLVAHLYDKYGEIIQRTETFGPYQFYDRGTSVKYSDFKENTILLAQYKNGQINVLRNPGLITIKHNGTSISTEPDFDTVDFIDNDENIKSEITLNGKTITIKFDFVDTFKTKITNLLNKYLDILNILDRVQTLETNYTALERRVSALEGNNNAS